MVLNEGTEDEKVLQVGGASKLYLHQIRIDAGNNCRIKLNVVDKNSSQYTKSTFKSKYSLASGNILGFTDTLYRGMPCSGMMYYNFYAVVQFFTLGTNSGSSKDHLFAVYVKGDNTYSIYEGSSYDFNDTVIEL